VKLIAAGDQSVFQPEGRVKLAHEIGFQFCQGDLGRRNAEVSEPRRLDDLRERHLVVRQDLVNGMGDFLQGKEGQGAVGLRVQVATQSRLEGQPVVADDLRAAANGSFQLAYIVERPVSSAPRFSSHFRSSSLLTLSVAALEIFEFFSTSSST